MKHRFNLLLPESMLHSLEKEAQRRGTNVSHVIRECIRFALKASNSGIYIKSENGEYEKVKFL